MPGLVQNTFDASRLRRTSSNTSVLVSLLLKPPTAPKQPIARQFALEMPVPFGPRMLVMSMMEWIGPAAKDAAQRDGVEDFDVPIPFEVAVAAERSAADAGAAAKASSRALGIAEAGRSAGVELVMGEFLASQHTDQQRAELFRNGDIEVQTHQVLGGLFRQVVVLHAGSKPTLEPDVIEQEVAEHLAVRELVEADRASGEAEELARADGAGFSENRVPLAVLVQFEVDQVRAIFPDVEVIDAALGSVERVSVPGNATGNNIAAAGHARIGRVEVPRRAHRSVVHKEERHRFRRWRRLERHIRGVSIASHPRKHRGQCDRL